MPDHIISEFINIDDIPCCHIRPSGEKHAPLLFFYHGWGSKKENHRFLARILAQFGYQVIIPDAMYHGERGHLNYHSREGYEHFWEVVIRSVREAEKLLIYVKENQWSDEVSIAGSSMGGMIASSIFTRHACLKTLINYNGASAWEVADRIFREREGWASATAHEIAELRKYDPIIHLDQIKQRPVLLFHGDKDELVPVQSQQVFYEAVCSRYGTDSERFKLEIIPRLNHHITIQMVEKMVHWLSDYGKEQ